MHFAVDGQHRDFYRTHHWIEFESLLTPAQLDVLNHEIDTTLAARLNTPIAKINDVPSETLFAQGHDVWRGANPIKKIVLNKGFAEACSELIEHKPLRFGYDQLFPMTKKKLENGSYASHLSQNKTLQEISCLQGVLCGLMLCLKAPKPSGTLTESALFASTAGSGIVFAPNWPLPLADLTFQEDSSYLLIVYTQSNSVYRMEENDPHTNAFKQLGYNFGDRLNDKLNPLVYV